jgi:hypothetical protein
VAGSGSHQNKKRPPGFHRGAFPCSRGRSRSLWSLQDLNLRHPRCERGALPAELSDRYCVRTNPVQPNRTSLRCVHTPTGTRTPVSAVRGRCPGPLDDGGVYP